MKPRRWILFVALAVAVLLSGLYAGWKITGADEKVRQALLEKARPFLSDDSDIGKVRVGIRGLHLESVSLSTRNRALTVRVEDVRLGVDLKNFITHGLSLDRIVDEIVLVKPVFTVRRFVKTTGESGTGVGEMDRRLDSFRRITMLKGIVILADSTGQAVSVIHRLSGWITIHPLDSAYVRLSGSLFDSQERNLSVEGHFNLVSGKPIGIKAGIDAPSLPSQLPLLIPGYFAIGGGRVKGDLSFSEERGTEGFFDVLDGTFSFVNTNIRFEEVTIHGLFDKGGIRLDGNVRRFNGFPMDLSGRIDSLSHPILDLSLRCPFVDIPSFLFHVLPQTRLPLQGKARFALHISGEARNPRVEGALVSSDLRVAGLPFHRFRTGIVLADSVLVLEGRGIQENGLSLNIDGSIDFAKAGRPVDLAARIFGNGRAALPAAFRKAWSTVDTDCEIHTSGLWESVRSDGRARIVLVHEGTDTLVVLPGFRQQGNTLAVFLSSNRSFGVMGTIQDPFSIHSRWDIKSDGLSDLLAPMVPDLMKNTVAALGVKADVSGSSNRWNISLRGEDPKGSNPVSALDAKAVLEKDENGRRKLSVSGSVRNPVGESVPWEARGMFSARGLEVQDVRVGQWFTAWGRLPSDPGEKWAGMVRLADLDLSRLHGFFPGFRPFSGRLHGSYEFTGTRTLPFVQVRLDLRNGQFHGTGVYEGEVAYRVEGRRLHSARLSFRKDQAVLFSGEASRSVNDSLTGEFQGVTSNWGDVIQALTGKSLFRGNGEARVVVGGAAGRPVLKAVIGMHEGMFGPVYFKEFSVEAVDSLDLSGGLVSGILTVSRGRVTRDDGLQAMVWGNLSHGIEREDDISLQADGNLLGFLSELSPGIRHARGNGNFFLRWTGKSGKWALENGRVDLKGGGMEVAVIDGRVDDLQAECEFDPQSRFFRIQNMTGKIGDASLRVSNRMPGAGDADLQPIVVSGPGIFLGILEIRTEGRPVRLHIPGLMEKGESGGFEWKGLDSSGPLTVSGPMSSPLIQGTFDLSDSRFTYPFLALESDSKSGNSLSTLERIRWNLRIITEKDVHYTRNIQSPFGTVYVDLKTRDDIGELRVQGQAGDHSIRVWGNLVSTEGTIEVLDHFFKIERITFDYPQGADDPLMAGRASTTVIDSMGIPSVVWLDLVSVEQATGLEKKGGPWEKIQFRFSSENPNLGRTEADLLSAMGYSMEAIKDRAYDALGMQIENAVFRPLFRPLERGIRRYLRLDVFRVSSMFSRNLFTQWPSASNVGFDPWLLLRDTRLTLGKSIFPGFLVTYSGQIERGFGFRYPTRELGFRHALSLEYSIRPDLFLEMEYTYDSLLLSDRREDKRIWLRHVFPF